MGAPERSGGGIGVNYGVGTIVWVRRRNGSWWPGRILTQEELSASHVRSGTPVKLLGREDASVDWYNLEKSKRVKAFRCGEFDACIERAEASQGIPIKKREKYARREDAILHALELEKEQLELKKQQSGTFSNSTSKKISGSRKRDLHDFASDLYTRKGNPKAHGKSTSKKSQMIPKKVGLPVEEIYADKKKSGKQVSSGENILEAIPRMRGLQDFGLKIVPSKRKLSQAVACQTSINSVDDHVEVQSSAGHTVESVRNVGGSKNFFLSKSKRSEDSMIEESLAKRSDKQHTPVQVLQCNAKLPVSQFPHSDDTGLVTMQREADPLNSICRAKRTRCIYLPSNSSESLGHLGDAHEQTPILEMQFEMDSLGEECTSSVIVEPSYSDSSETNYVEPGADEHLNPPSDTTQRLVPESQNSVGHADCEPSGDEVAQVNGDMNSHEVHLPGYMSELHLPKVVADASNDTGVSKWHMKGKRNIRHVTNRPMDAVDQKALSSITSKIGKSESLTQGTLGHVLHTKKQGISSAYDALDLLDDDSGHAQTLDYGSQRKTLAFKAAKGQMRGHCGFNGFDNASNTMSPTGWEADGFNHAPQRVYWDESCEHLESIYPDHHNDEWEPKLVVVDLKVQASSYKGEHNPLVSLMSRLNGKAIVGHPVQIETLEDGSIGSLLFRGDVGLDDGAKTARVWRTGKRTAMQRVARINPVSTALESEGIEPDKCPGSESKPPPIKAYSGHFSCQTRSKKSISHISRSSPGKVQQKLQKKFKLSSQKTRVLSSIATEHKLGGEKGDAKHLRRNKLLGGLIKSEATMPLVTCVPVKEVFSRIMEAISRPPSAAGQRIR